MISSVQQIKFSQLVVDFSQRDSNLTVLYLFCKEIRTKFYIIETSIWLNVEYIQSMFFSVCHWRKWHGHEKTAGALDTYCTGGNQSCASRASNILLTACFALFYNVLSSVWFASEPWKNCFHSKKMPMSNERRAENESIYWIWCVMVCLDFIPGPYHYNQPS